MEGHTHSAEAALWSLVNSYGSAWWWGQSALCAIIFIRMFFMRSPETWTGVFARVGLWIGTFMMAISPFNTGMGPYAYYVILLALFLMVNQLCDASAPSVVATPGATVVSHTEQIVEAKAAMKEVVVGRPLWERAVLHVIGPQGAINIAAKVQHEQVMADALSGKVVEK